MFLDLSYPLVFFIIKYKPGRDEIAAEIVNNKPILKDSSSETVNIDAALKKTNSLIPIPPKEKIERIDDIT